MVASGKPIRCVLFDAGGTLFSEDAMVPGAKALVARLAQLQGRVSPNSETFATWAAAAFGSLRPRLAEAMSQDFYLFASLFQAAWADASRAIGLGWDDAWCDELYSAFGAGCARGASLVPGAGEACRQLRASGIVTGVVSNMDDVQLAPIGHALGFATLVDFVLSSEQARSCKPHGAIFQQALARAACAADETLYVGDMVAHDVVGANRAGLRSVLTTQAAMGKIELPHGASLDEVPDHTITSIDQLLELIS